MDPASAFSFVASYCGFPPTPDTLWGRWNFEPFLLISLFLVAACGSRLSGPVPRRQWVFATAWLLSAMLFVSPICALTVALFSARVSHHMALIALVAPLIAFALPARWGRAIALLPSLMISTALLWLWHLPAVYALTFAHPVVYWAMELSLLGSAVWLWLGILRSGQTFTASLTALGSAMQMGFLGALLVFAPEPLYWPHFGQTLAFGLTANEDQQLAGLIMWVPATAPFLAAVLWRLVSGLMSESEALQ